MADKTQSGLWIVRRGEAQWLAWQEWLKLEIGRKFWPDNATVPMEWPPTTVESAQMVADHFRDARTDAAKDKDAKGLVFKPVPISPQPWIRWSPNQIAQRIAAHNAEQNPPTQPPRDMGHITRLLASSGLVPWYRESYKPDAARMQKRELSESEKAELAFRESALRTERAEKLSAKLPRYVPGAGE